MTLSPPLLTILGPTASGKTRLAVALCRRFGGEVISADSRQVYRGMDVGTGKDREEYGEVPCHLIDVVDPGEPFDLFLFQTMALEKVAEIQRRGALPVVAGGTGLYLQSLVTGVRLREVPVDPDLRRELEGVGDGELAARLLKLRGSLHNTTDTTDRGRLIRALEIAEYERRHPPEPLPPMDRLTIGISIPRERLKERIRARLALRLGQGLVEEVATLHDRGVSWERMEYFGLEYRYVSRFLRGLTTREEMERDLASAIGDFAKRQTTWFRRMERLGVPIRWVDGERDPLAEAESVVAGWLHGRSAS